MPERQAVRQNSFTDASLRAASNGKAKEGIMKKVLN